VKVLGSTFFDRSAEEVAHDLIGCRLCWGYDDQIHSRTITETEAYTGPDDLASHAANWMLNVVTGPVGYPAAVLIRGVEGIVGPGRLTKALRINGNLNGKQASKEAGFWFSRGAAPKFNVSRSSRIGVGYAGPIGR
jgi:DNA-3-methyladenine glycosylase